MRCPACGNEVYERIDYALVQCTQCGGLWDALMYPGFPVLNVEWGAIWDTSEPVDDDLLDGDDDLDDDSGDEQMEDGEDDNFDNQLRAGSTKILALKKSLTDGVMKMSKGMINNYSI